MTSYVFKCPECGIFTTCGLNKDIFCSECGLKLILVNTIEDYPTVDSDKHQSPELKEENQEETMNKSQEETMNLPFPKGMKLREQNPECNKQGHYCGDMKGQLICLTSLEKIEDKDGNTPLFDIKVCSKNPDKELTFSEVDD